MRFLLALLLSTPFAAAALSSGSPDCANVQHGFTVSAGTGGYALTVPVEYVGDQQVTITLTGTTPFKGVLMFGSDNSSQRVGNWQFPAGYRGVVSCNGSVTNTLTHDSATPKSLPVSFTWTAPPPGTGTVTLRATVAVDFANFFTIQAAIPENVDAMFANGFE